MATKTRSKASSTSGIDFGSLAPKGTASRAVAEVLEAVPAGVVPGKFKSLQALATRVFKDSKGELSARTIDGRMHIVRLDAAGK